VLTGGERAGSALGEVSQGRDRRGGERCGAVGCAASRARSCRGGISERLGVGAVMGS